MEAFGVCSFMLHCIFGCIVAFCHYFPTASLVFAILTLVGALTLTLYFLFGDVEGREQIKIKLNGGMMPKKANSSDAAYDVYAPEDVLIDKSRILINLGFSLQMPHGMGAFIRARSGYLKNGIYAVEEFTDGRKDEIFIDSFTPTGLIDCGYRGNLGVIAITWNLYCHLNTKRIYIPKGTRIAQMQFVAVPDTELVESDELDMTDDRGGGFGHTNK